MSKENFLTSSLISNNRTLVFMRHLYTEDDQSQIGCFHILYSQNSLYIQLNLTVKNVQRIGEEITNREWRGFGIFCLRECLTNSRQSFD